MIMKPTDRKIEVSPYVEEQGGEGDGGDEKKSQDRSEDPHLSMIWDKSDDMSVRRVAKLKIVKKWELLKMCRDVIDENNELVDSMNLKESTKENVSWPDNERKSYNDWKAKNIRYMSLKNSKQKERSGPFDQFCNKKGWGKEKEMWEVAAKNETETKEKLIKEIAVERKSKSRKKKLEIYRKCRKVLLNELTDWKTSPGVEEDKEYKTLKEVAREERTQKEFANMKLKKTEERRQKLETETSQHLETHKVMCKLSEPIKPFVVMRAIDLVCGKPEALSLATVDGTMKKTIFTKPQQIHSRLAAEALSSPGPV
jgi:hypothetical protein